MNVLQTLASVWKHFSDEAFSSKFVEILKKGAEDKIANVRFCTARIILSLKDEIDPSVFSEHISPLLEILKDDKDREVVYFVSKALN